MSKLQALVYSIIKKRRQVIEEQWQNTEERNEDLLDLLIEARDREGDGKGFSDQQIMEEVMTFMVQPFEKVGERHAVDCEPVCRTRNDQYSSVLDTLSAERAF